MKRHYNITVKGRVQGVGFRFETQRQARFMGIRGFVKNQHDGSVYIEAEGEEDILQQFLNWCHHGPSFANVSKVHYNEDEKQGYTSFDVRF